MSTNKLKPIPEALELEDLLKVAAESEPIDPGSTDHGHDVLNFISTFALEPGEEYIKQHTLYLIYKVWSKQPYSKGIFLNFLRRFFQSKQQSRKAGFAINQSAIKLTHAAYKQFSNKSITNKNRPWPKHFENFLKFHSLTKGDVYLHSDIVYFIYDKYCHATGLDRKEGNCLGKETFKHYCKIYFPEKITKKGAKYGLSDNIRQFFQIGQLERMVKEYEKEEVKKKRGKARGFKTQSKPKNKV